jgi:galactokinase
VEHGDYNGTELFGVGTDRFIWLAYKENALGTLRLFSENFPDDGMIQCRLDCPPQTMPAHFRHHWGRFPLGVVHVLAREGYALSTGFDAVLYGNIPGGGMSRSASLTLNLLLTLFEVNDVRDVSGLKIVELAQSVENDFIGSPCGNLDQLMIYFARAGMGTHYMPHAEEIEYVPLGSGAADFRIVSLDTGTDRPGLEKSTYKVRRAECEMLVELAREEFGIRCLADVHEPVSYARIVHRFQETHPHLCRRLAYVYEAQQRFQQMLAAWKNGDVETVGQLFRADGIGLRDQYEISGPELETMCDLARSVPGVLGERMLGGGDKGAAGALVRVDSVDELHNTVRVGYPRSRPEYADRFAVHACQMVDGICRLEGLTAG